MIGCQRNLCFRALLGEARGRHTQSRTSITCREFVRRRATRHEKAGSLTTVQSSIRFPIDDYCKEATSEFGADGCEGVASEICHYDQSLAAGSDAASGESIYQDLDRSTFNDFLDTLLDSDNFNFYKEVDGRALISPSWTYCLSHTSSSYAKRLFAFVKSNTTVFRRPFGPLYAIPSIV